MGKREYLGKLLGLCTKEQVSLHKRMYPNGVGIKQLAHAIFQAENTLKGLNDINAEYRQFKKDSLEQFNKLEDENKIVFKSNGELTKEVNALYLRIEKLSNKENIDNANTQERLELLAALQAGGVDNWDGYDISIEEYSSNE